jgi:hypothetical protein
VARTYFQRYLDPDTSQYKYYQLDTSADTATPYTGDINKIQWSLDEDGRPGNSGMYNDGEREDPSYNWSKGHGLLPVLYAIEASNRGEQFDPRVAQWLQSQAGGATPQDQWNNYVASVQDKDAHGSDMFGINGLDSGTWQGPLMMAAAIGGGAFLGGAGGGAAAGGTSSGGSGAAAAAGAEGGTGMWDWLDDVGMDEFGNTGGEFTGGSSDFFDPMASGGSMMPAAVPEADPTFGGTLTDVGNGSFEDIGSADLAARNFGAPTNLLSRLGDAALVQRLLGGGRSAAAGGTGGGAGGGMGLGDMAFNSAPFLLAAYMANQQRNDINPYIDRLNSLNDRFAGNESPYIKSLTDPYDMSTAQQRGTLTMGLGNRGVLGSSFGDNALDNFGYMRDVGRGNLTAQAINQSVGAQSQLTDQAIKGVNVRNANTNALLGAGLNASAKLFSPQRDPFGLSEILRLTGAA